MEGLPIPSGLQKMSKFSTLFAYAALLPALSMAAQPLYAQCGGTGWSE